METTSEKNNGSSSRGVLKKIGLFLFRFLRVVVVIGIAAALAYFLFSLKKEPEKKKYVITPPSVKVMEAIPVSKNMVIEAFGTVKPRKLVKIAVEVPGRIAFVHPSFTEGGMIKKGEVLARIDQRSYKLDRESARVRVAQAKTDIKSLKQDIANLENDIKLSRANLGLAEKDRERVAELNKHQFASRNSLDKAEQLFLQAKIQFQSVANRLTMTDTLMDQRKSALAMARVNFQKADLALQKTRIISDFDGLVLDKFAEKGEYVNPGQTIGSIYQEGGLDVDIRIPLEKMKWIESAFKDGKTPEATVIFANSGEKTPLVWKARVARLKARIDEKTRTLPMTLEIVEKDDTENKKETDGEPGIFDLKPGTFVKCSIIGEIFRDIYALPRHLVKRNDILYTVNDSHLKMIKVSILRKFEDEIYINGGLAPGDHIITSPLPGALEGMEVTIKSNGE